MADEEVLSEDERRARAVRRQELIAALRELSSTEEGREVAFNVLNPPPASQRAYYFGCWGEKGHFLYTETRSNAEQEVRRTLPWEVGELDSTLCPGYVGEHNNGPEEEGAASLHYKSGWTALSFWDRSVDERRGSNSTLLVQGLLSFQQMLEVGKTRFPRVFGRFKFEIVHAPYGYGRGALLRTRVVKRAKILLEDVKDPDGWEYVVQHLGLSDAVKYAHFQFGEVASVEIDVDSDLRIVGGRVVPLAGDPH